MVLNFLLTISDSSFGLNSFLIAPDYCICMSIVTESLLSCGFLLFTVDCSSHSHYLIVNVRLSPLPLQEPVSLQPFHVLQCHSRQDSPDDFSTQLWACAFEPSLECSVGGERCHVIQLNEISLYA